MKLKMRRLFAFFLALLFFVPAGMPAAAQGDAENKADLLAQVAIESSEPDGDGVYTMDFSVKQDMLLYPDRTVNKAFFIFSFDSDVVVPVDAANKNAVTISDGNEAEVSPFVSGAQFQDPRVQWGVNEADHRTIVKVDIKTTNLHGVKFETLTKAFSFSYKLNGEPKQGIFRIESDSDVINRFEPVDNYGDDENLNAKTDIGTDAIIRFDSYDNLSTNKIRAGIFIRHFGESKPMSNGLYRVPLTVPTYSKFNSIKEDKDDITLKIFKYPGSAGTTKSDICDYILTSSVGEGGKVIMPSWSPSDVSLSVVARNADGVKIPFTSDDTLKWSLQAQDEKVEAFRQADINEGTNSVTLVDIAGETCVMRIKPSAYKFHRHGFNKYIVTLEISLSDNRTIQKQTAVNLEHGQLTELRPLDCTVIGGIIGDGKFVYHFPDVPDRTDSQTSDYEAKELLTVPRPSGSEKYTFDFTLYNDLFEEIIKPETNNHFMIKSFSGPSYSNETDKTTSFGPSIWEANGMQVSLGKTADDTANQLTLNITSPNSVKAGTYDLTFWVKNGGISAPLEYPGRFKMSFRISDFAYEWPDLFMQDTPLIMKPSQTYGELLEELKARDSGTFFKDYATIPYKTPEERLPGAVTVESSDKAPEDGKSNYVTFTFTVNNPGGSYDGQKLQFTKPVKIASLPTGPISAAITQVDGKDFNGQPIELEVTKSQLVKAGDLQALGFPSTVSLSWDGGSTQVSGSDLKFDTALAVLQALNVGDTMDVSLQPPADNITLTNGLTVKVKVVPTGLGAGAGTVALPAGTTYTYTGSPLTPAPTVTVGGVMLNKDTDYTVEYMDNVNAGTGKIIITGKGNYSGTIEKDFTISKAPLPGVTVDGADLTTADPKYYTAQAGDVLTPKFENGLDPSIADWVWKEQGTDTVVSNKRVYVPKAADAGREIYAEAAAKPNSNYTGTAQSLPVKILIPISGSVYIKADPTSGGGGASAPIGPGTELTAVITPNHPSAVTWDYQWKKNGADIPGATGETYTLKADDTTDGAGNFSRITVSVTPKTGSPATGGLKSEDAVTVGKKPLDVGTVTVTRESPGGAGGVIGGAQPGDKLIASVTPTGGGEAPANPPYKFVWIKDGTPIDGEEGPEYTLKPGDKGKEITVAVVPKEDSGEYTGTVPNTSPIQVPPTKPGSPENVTVTPGSGGGSVKVSWDPPADDGGEPIEEYKVVVKDGDGNTVAEVPVDHDKNECEVPVPDGDKEYKAEVVAVNNVGDSDPATPADPAKPDPKPTSKPGSGGGYVPWNPTPKPSPSPDPTSSPSPGPTASPSPSPDPWPSDCPRDETCPIAPFPDSNPKAWYHDGLHFCTGKDLMNGYANGLLGPNDPMTRAQLAMILYNMEDRPDNSGLSGFTDVPSDAWYAKAVTWANEEQVMVGYDNGCFGPNDPVTREQMTATLYRYAGSPPAGGSLEQFTDWREVSDYAKESMAWAVGEGLVSGIGNNRLSPRGTSTRAQVGTIIYLYCKLVSYPGA